MPVDRISVAFDADLGRFVRNAAAEEGVSVSRWLGEAAADRLRNRLMRHALDEWEAEDGPLTQEELDAAADELELPRIPRSDSVA